MSTERALAPAREPVELAEVRAQRGITGLPSQAHIDQLLNLGDMLVKSGLLPQSLRTKEAAATVILKGNELGLPPMAAMEGIAVVQGKAVLSAGLLMALVKREYGPGAIWVSETTNERCTVSYRIPGVPNVLTYSFTIDDARQAGLADKQIWRQYPAAMLRARCISAAVKLAFPEVVGGVYVAGELPGTEAIVTDDGDVIVDVTAGAAESRPEPQPEPRPEPRRPQNPRPQAAQPPLEPEPVDAPEDLDAPVPDGAGITFRQVRRFWALAGDLPLDGREAKAAEARKVVRGVLGMGADGDDPSIKAMDERQAGEAIFRLEAFDQDLRDSLGLPPRERRARGGLPLVDAEPVEGEPGDDRHTR